MKVRKAPVIYIGWQDKQLLDLYVASSPVEISCLGVIVPLGNDFLIKEIVLLPQSCSAEGDETVIGEQEILRLLNELLDLDLDPSGYKLWFHSHVNMGVFWSPTDEKTASTFCRGWSVSIVANKAGDYRCRLDIYEPVHVTIDHLELRVIVPTDEALAAKVEAEVIEKVTILPPRKKKGQYIDLTDLGFEEEEEE